MNLTVAIPPYAEPLHLDEAKNHLKVDLAMTDDDELISSQITAARNLVESATGAGRERSKVMVATTFDQTTDYGFGYRICLQRVPVISITSITYIDSGGTTQTLSTDVYELKGNDVCLKRNQSWPSTDSVLDSVTVRYVAGMVAPFTAATSDTLTIQGRSFSVGDRVRLLNSGGQLPPPFTANTDYFVISGPKLSTTSGGSAVDVTAVGSGTHFIGLDFSSFQTLRTSLKLRMAHWYENREAVLQTGAIPKALPYAVDALEMTELA